MKPQGIIIVIATVVVTVLVLAAYPSNRNHSSETIGDSVTEIIDRAKEGGKEFRGEIEDEIDDHTTTKN